MVDTVILLIRKDNFLIWKKEMFTLISAKKKNGILVFSKFVSNATPEDVRLGIYKPRLTISQRGQEAELKIEFSAAKIIFKNNLQEITEEDFKKILEILLTLLNDMGVVVSKEVLEKAEVRTFHPSKNILITGGYFVMDIIKDFAKINLTEKMEFDHKDYRNNGHGLQFRAETHALTFYDKILDLEKSEKKSFSKDQKLQQQSLFDLLERKIKPEIFRMEVRLCEKRKINSILSRLGLAQNPTFSDLFKNQVCQKVLLYYFETYIEPSLFIFDFESTPQKILKTLFKNNPNTRPATALELTGLKLICKDKGGVRDLRRILGKRASKRSWDRIAVKIKILNKTATIENCQDYIKQIKTALEQFKPYSLPNTEPVKSSFDLMQGH